VLGDVPPPRGQVANPARQTVGVEGVAEEVHGGRQQRRVDTLVEQVEGAVRGDEDAVRSHDYGRVREVALKDGVQRVPHRCECLVVER
jgi:hypothetical protein